MTLLQHILFRVVKGSIAACLLASMTGTSLLASFLVVPGKQAHAAGGMCSASGGAQPESTDPNYEAPIIGWLSKRGGVKLDQAAKFLADMSDITGAYYDAGRDQIVFVGKDEVSVPKFNKDDLAVAIRSVFFAQANPGVKIEYVAPDDPNVWEVSQNMNVNYMPSKEGDQSNPNGQWKDADNVMRDSTPYGIEDTAFAKVLFDADLKLKQYFLGYSAGLGPEGQHWEQPVSSGVSGYQSHHARYLAKNPDLNSARGALTVWMSPDEITVKRDDASQSFIFDNVSMKVEVQNVMSDTSNQKWLDAANEFATHHTQHFDQFAQETPAYFEVERLAKIVGVVKWIQDNGIATDFQWARDYEPAFVETPRTIPMIRFKLTENPDRRMGGGMNFFEPNTYISGSGQSTSLKQSALAAQPTRADFHWNFSNNGQAYEAVAVSAELFRDTGSYATQSTDLALQTRGDIPLAVTRSYSSQANDRSYVMNTNVGNSWDIMPARLTDTGSLKPPSCQPQGMTGIMPTNIAFETQSGLYETFTFACPGGQYQPDHPSYTSQITFATDGTYTVKTKDQVLFAFKYYTEYGTRLRLNKITDRNTNSIYYEYYEPSANLSKIRDDYGQYINATYGPQQRVSTITDSTGRTVTYEYTQGRLTKVHDVAGAITQYQYDTDGRLTGIIDPAGNTIVANQYNDLNKLTSQTNALQGTTQYTYNENNRTITTQRPNGATHTLDYDDSTRLVAETDALGNATTYSYTGNSYWPQSVTDKRGNVAQYQYDSRGNVTSVTMPNNATVTTQYNSADLPTEITDNRYSPSRNTTFLYDAKYNLLKQITDNISFGTVYDQYGQVTQGRGPNNEVVTTYSSNTRGLPTSVTDSLNRTTTYAYDSVGRVTQETDPLGKARSFTYDAAGNVLTMTDAAGTTQYTYNNLNRLTQVRLPDTTVTTFTYNAAGGLTKVTDAKGNETTYTYDTLGNLTARHNASGATYTNEYDALQRVKKVLTPLQAIDQATYDAAGNVATTTDAGGRVTSSSYDALNRLTQLLLPDQTSLTRAYDARGNITSANSPAGQSTFAYDAFDRMTTATDPFGNSLGYAYDNYGRLTQLTYPDQRQAGYTYNTAGELTKLTDWNGYETLFEYYANGLLKDKTLPNGVTVRHAYDNANRVSQVQYLRGASVIGQTDIEHSLTGNITKLTDSGQLFTQTTLATTPPSWTTPSPADITAHWTLDETSGSRQDSSGKNNHLSDNNTVTSSTSAKQGSRSADFERDNTEYLSITDANQTGLDTAGAKTFAFWVQRESTGSDHVIMQKYTGSNHSFSLSFLNDNRLNFTISGNGTSDVSVNSSQSFTTTGTWYHVAAIFVPNTSLTLYVNGQLSNQSTTNIPGNIFNGTAPLHIGSVSSNPAASASFDGLLDDVYVYNKALTHSDVNQLMYASSSPLVARWTLDEVSGTRQDSSGKNNHLTDNNTTASSVAAKQGSRSADFERNNTNYLSLADNSLTGIDDPTAKTFSFWVRRESSGGDQIMMQKYAGSNHSLSLSFLNDNRLNFTISGNGTSDVSVNSQETFTTLGTWYHVAAVFTPNTSLALYVNGVLSNQTTANIPGNIFNGNSPLHIGSLSSNPTSAGSFDGLLDDVYVYNKALSLDEIVRLRDSVINDAGTAQTVVTTFTYDQLGQLTSATYPDGTVYQYTYDAIGNRTTSVKAGQTTHYIYDNDAKLLSSSDNSYTYNTVGELVTKNSTQSGVPTSLTPPAPSNIQARWKFDETNGTRSDSSGKGNHINDNNTVTSSSDAKEGVKSADFERDNTEYLSITDANQTGLDTAGAKTFAFWLKRESTGGAQILINKYVETGSQRSYSLSLMNDNRINFTISGNGTSDVAVNSTTALSTSGVWKHITAVFEPSTALKLYIDGTLDAQNTTSIPANIFNSSAPVHIGSSSQGPASSNSYDGLLDDMYVYNKALTANEITQLINASASPLAAHWTLDETSGTRQDSSGKNNHVSDNNTVLSSTTVKQGSRSADFERDNTEYLSLSDSSLTAIDDPTAKTFAFWVQRESTGSDHVILQKYTGSNHSFSLSFLNDNRLNFTMSGNGTTDVSVNSSQAFTTTGTWYHVAAVFIPNTSLTLYVNGQLSNQSTTSIPSSIFNGTAPLHIGSVSASPAASGSFDGLLDDVYIYNKALSATEITDIINAAISGTSYTYDTRGNVVGATTPDTTSTYVYDSLGNRIKKTVGTSETRFVNDTSGELPYVLAETNSVNQIESMYLYGAGLTSVGGTTTTDRLYPLPDPTGNTRFLLDNSGNLVARYSYDPFGSITNKEGSSNTQFTFSNEQADGETGLTFLRARYYDPTTGRFLSRDPILGPLTMPLEHGEYVYSQNNPINLSDPSGKFAILIGDSGSIGIGNGGRGLATGVGAGFALVWGDRGFEWGRYYDSSGGFITGADVSVGVTATFDNARSLADLAGAGLQLGGAGKYLYGLSGDINFDQKNKKIQGITVGLGIGGAAQAHIFKSYTVIYDKYGNLILPGDFVESIASYQGGSCRVK